ncbi:MAG TPA: glycosyltransferase family 2 protein [Bacteroidia bacterium]|nr:glycosyltransferase family 2 protein [Bacteroidia bacterium]
MEKIDISIVVPLYNESASLPHLIERLEKLRTKLPGLSIEIIFVDDGSKDNTGEIIQQLALSQLHYQAILLSRNYGHQLALTCGLAQVRATQAVMVIDGDLQDPPELLTSFYEYYKQGSDVVYAVRQKRKESFFKKTAYYFFYRILKSISYVDIPLDSGDFCLMSRRVVDVLNQMPEESRYLRGMRSWIGFKQTGVEYEREERIAGSSSYSLKDLIRLAYNGIFNFSEFPIKFIKRLGYAAICASFIYFVYSLIMKFVYQNVPQGFTALLFTFILFSGIQFLSLGIIGEYILRIFFQVKNRPLYIVKNKIVNKEITH